VPCRGHQFAGMAEWQTQRLQIPPTLVVQVRLLLPAPDASLA
jgi:hypothetical protein